MCVLVRVPSINSHSGSFPAALKYLKIQYLKPQEVAICLIIFSHTNFENPYGFTGS